MAIGLLIAGCGSGDGADPGLQSSSESDRSSGSDGSSTETEGSTDDDSADGSSDETSTTVAEPEPESEEDTTTTVAPEPEPETETATGGRLFAASFAIVSELWDVTEVGDLYIGQVTASGVGIELTDIANFDESRLIGTSFTDTYLIDPETAEATLLGANGIGLVNALVAGADGFIYAATTTGDFLTIDPDSGAGRRVGAFGGGFTSSGDLAFDDDGVLYATVKGPSGEALVTVDPTTGIATALPVAMPKDVFGLSWVNSKLYGMVTSESTACAEGALLDIDPQGDVAEIRCLEFFPGGATNDAR